MPFQFLCPQGHLLQADPSHMGWTIQCPTCGVTFVIPTIAQGPIATPVVPAPIVPSIIASPAAPATGDKNLSPEQPIVDVPAEDVPWGNLPDRPRRRGRGGRKLDLGDITADLPDPAGGPATDRQVELPDLTAGRPAEAFGSTEAAPRMVHIPCPNGHELITPMDTMGEEVLCPHCGEQFVLRYADTLESQREERIKAEVREERLGRKWFVWAVAVGIVVLIMLLAMIIFSSRT